MLGPTDIQLFHSLISSVPWTVFGHSALSLFCHALSPPPFACLKRILLWCSFSNITHQSGSKSMAWNVSYDPHPSSNWFIEDQYTNLPRAALKFVQVLSCTRSPGGGVRRLQSHPAPLTGQDARPGCIPRMVCLFWFAFGPREALSGPWSSPSQRSQSLVFISSPTTLWMFFKEEDMPKAKAKSFWRYVSYSVREEGKKR